MTVSIMGKTLSLKCVLDPMEPWDLEMSPHLEKGDYSDDAEKERGINPTVTVIGFRDRVTNTWDFYFQRQLSNTVPNPSGRGSPVHCAYTSTPPL